MNPSVPASPHATVSARGAAPRARTLLLLLSQLLLSGAKDCGPHWDSVLYDSTDTGDNIPDTLEEASPIPDGWYGPAASDRLEHPNDVDFWRYDLADGDKVRVRLGHTTPPGGEACDVRLAVYDQAGQPIGANDDVAMGMARHSAELAWEVSGDGTVYFEVSQAPLRPEGTDAGARCGYGLYLDAVEGFEPGPNDTQEQAVQLLIDHDALYDLERYVPDQLDFAGRFSSPEDVDLWPIQVWYALRDRPWAFALWPGPNPGYSPRLCVYDPDGALAACTDTPYAGTSGDPAVDAALVLPVWTGIWYLAVENPQGVLGPESFYAGTILPL